MRNKDIELELKYQPFDFEEELFLTRRGYTVKTIKDKEVGLKLIGYGVLIIGKINKDYEVSYYFNGVEKLFINDSVFIRDLSELCTAEDTVFRKNVGGSSPIADVGFLLNEMA